MPDGDKDSAHDTLEKRSVYERLGTVNVFKHLGSIVSGDGSEPVVVSQEAKAGIDRQEHFR